MNYKKKKKKNLSIPFVVLLRGKLGISDETVSLW
jgi:hypothetical protein